MTVIKKIFRRGTDETNFQEIPGNELPKIFQEFTIDNLWFVHDFLWLVRTASEVFFR